MPDELMVLLAMWADALAKNQIELEPEAKRVLYENLWDLYDDNEEYIDA